MNGRQSRWGADIAFVWLILAGFSSSWLHFAEPDGVDMGYPGAIPRMSCPSLPD